MAEILRLQLIGAVKKVNTAPSQYLSSYFLADKSDGGKRFILNLNRLNKFLDPPHFKMEDFRTVLRLIQKDCYMASIDLRDAYLLIPIHMKYRKYLRFKFQKVIYEFQVLPFGVSTAPYTFTKMMKPLIQNLRAHGIITVNYLDDILILGSTKTEYRDNVHTALQLLQSLGFLINLKKSSLIPNKSCKFLGLVFNSTQMSVQLTLEKKLRILKWTRHFLKKRTFKIRLFAKLLGLLVAACPEVKYGFLRTKSLERLKYLALKKAHMSYEGTMCLSPQATHDLIWWSSNITNSVNDIRQDNFDLEIFTDACPTGWGVYSNNERTHGWWSPSEQREHINFLELQAIFFGLMCFAKHLRNCNVLTRTDNTTAKAYINKMGSVRFPKLNNLARRTWQWCMKRNIWLYASYIPSHQNLEADEESRILPPETEWSLHIQAFKNISRKLGTPHIDLFATRHNPKCGKYVSWLRDPGAIAVDAFTLDWGKFFFYAFPPFSMILRCIQKIIADRAEGILVTTNLGTLYLNDYKNKNQFYLDHLLICYLPLPGSFTRSPAALPWLPTNSAPGIRVKKHTQRRHRNTTEISCRFYN
nr:unnamed protein product [Callosobruchus analis]